MANLHVGAAARQLARHVEEAAEIAREQPTATVVAASDSGTAQVVQEASSTPYFRPYTNFDVIGCELGGAVKNVIALACGMAHGLGLGDNTLASLITRGLSETARLGAMLGADPQTFAGLAGLGDLVATCASPLSRNRSFGARLGRAVPYAVRCVARQRPRPVHGSRLPHPHGVPGLQRAPDATRQPFRGR